LGLRLNFPICDDEVDEFVEIRYLRRMLGNFAIILKWKKMDFYGKPQIIMIALIMY